MKINRFLQAGWTLIELLIVLAIVAILMAIMVTSMIQPAMTRNNNQVMLNNVSTLVGAAHSYRLAHTDYDGLLDSKDGIVTYLNQDPVSASPLWQITPNGGVTCPSGTNPSTCPTSITSAGAGSRADPDSGGSSQQFTITIANIDNINSLEGLLQQSGGKIREQSDDDGSSGFTVTYD